MQLPHFRRLPAHQGLIVLALLLLVPFAISEGKTRLFAANTAVAPLTVQFSLPTGIYTQDITVRLVTPDPRAQILFTADGSLPEPGQAAIYSQPLHFESEPASVITIRARAVSPEGEMGPVINTPYFLGVEATIPILSLTAEYDDIWGQDRGIYSNPRNRGRDWERPIHITYLDENGHLGFQVDAGLRIHGNASRGNDKKSFRLYFREDYGQSWLRYPLFPGSQVNEFKRLVLRADGQEYPQFKANGTLIRNPLAADLSAQIDAYAPNNRPVVLFINGELWGIYNMREYINSQYYETHYGIEPIPGDELHYSQLEEFIRSNTLSNSSNYGFVQTQMDVSNFIDYNFMEMYVVNSDWPNNNISRFRSHSQGGRWHWIFWDLDNAFGIAPGSGLEYEMVEHTVNPENGWILGRFLENSTFRETFFLRTADLLNTTFHPDNVIAAINLLENEYGPNINYEVSRWPGSGKWTVSVEEMREFARLRPEVLRKQMIAAFGLDGTAVFTFKPPLEGKGTVAVNGHLNTLPWEGKYFRETTIRITAVPDPGFQFAGWDPISLPQTAVLNLTVSNDQIISPRFVPAPAEMPQPEDVFINNVGYAENLTLAENPVAGSWIELVVQRPGSVDLRGWRLTDNDTISATDEGSLIFSQHSALADVPQGTSIWLVVSEEVVNDEVFAEDDLQAGDKQMILYVGNDTLDMTTDPWFHLGNYDNLALLAPGPTDTFEDDKGIDFVKLGKLSSATNVITPDRFGILQDGVIGRSILIEFR